MIADDQKIERWDILLLDHLCFASLSPLSIFILSCQFRLTAIWSEHWTVLGQSSAKAHSCDLAIDQCCFRKKCGSFLDLIFSQYSAAVVPHGAKPVLYGCIISVDSMLSTFGNNRLSIGTQCWSSQGVILFSRPVNEWCNKFLFSGRSSSSLL